MLEISSNENENLAFEKCEFEIHEYTIIEYKFVHNRMSELEYTIMNGY